VKRELGQALVETALAVPLIMALSLGGVEVARVADARSGLDAATAAAASAGARATTASTATAAGSAAFRAAVAGYPLGSPQVQLDTGGFARGGLVRASGSAVVDLGLAPVPGLPRSVRLVASATARVAPWRSR
jgi:Flp pilus assembly protein TadG